MRLTVPELIALLSVEPVEEPPTEVPPRLARKSFVGPTRDLGWGQVFGGLVLGQALAAADATVPDDRLCHSLHGYFLRPGSLAEPITYTVEAIRDGGSFTTRRVTAWQHGEAIFGLAASFHVFEEGFEHHDPMPDAPDPDGLLSEAELARRADSPLPWDRRSAERAMTICPARPMDPRHPEVREPHRQVWYRASDELPADPRLHRRLLAFASDSHFMTTALQPHGVSWATRGIQCASLDHCMYFHRDFSLSEWLLYDVHSASASGSRGLVRGAFYTRDGRLVASTVQEGLIRDRR
ncbi:MAG: acyl-CoA thioesterase II [Deltaproteobacteria bacterium]|nr:MAG: acyl-CoA thioesterase II [Deltaproteobacteria bacterium]